MKARVPARSGKTYLPADWRNGSSEIFAGHVSSGKLFQFVSAMNLLWVFAAVAPLALASLFAFAAHIDPLSGRWRSSSATRREDAADA
ncbi:hypothetical protein [Caballeronia hypogeia]|uniref:hypothetical protein n=1 Tax=Caballeronia hypogeia TaxID=1777140 RepID=UPI0012FDBB0B|nr:hypothetical protein [Caballeronia hypogeia]